MTLWVQSFLSETVLTAAQIFCGAKAAAHIFYRTEEFLCISFYNRLCTDLSSFWTAVVSKVSSSSRFQTIFDGSSIIVDWSSITSLNSFLPIVCSDFVQMLDSHLQMRICKTTHHVRECTQPLTKSFFCCSSLIQVIWYKMLMWSSTGHSSHICCNIWQSPWNLLRMMCVEGVIIVREVNKLAVKKQWSSRAIVESCIQRV